MRHDSSFGLWSWLGCLCCSGLATTPQQGQYKPGVWEPRDPAPPLSAVLLQIRRPCAEPPGQVCLPHHLSVCGGLCPGRQTPPGSHLAAHTARHRCQHALIHESPRARRRRAGPAHGAEIPVSHSDPHRSQRARPSRRAEEGVDGQEGLLRRPHWADKGPLSPPGHTHGAHTGTSTPLGGNLADRHGNTPTPRPPWGLTCVHVISFQRRGPELGTIPLGRRLSPASAPSSSLFSGSHEPGSADPENLEKPAGVPPRWAFLSCPLPLKPILRGQRSLSPAAPGPLPRQDTPQPRLQAALGFPFLCQFSRRPGQVLLSAPPSPQGWGPAGVEGGESSGLPCTHLCLPGSWLPDWASGSLASLGSSC